MSYPFWESSWMTLITGRTYALCAAGISSQTVKRAAHICLLIGDHPKRKRKTILDAKPPFWFIQRAHWCQPAVNHGSCNMFHVGNKADPGIYISASDLQSPGTLTVVTRDRILDLRDFKQKAVWLDAQVGEITDKNKELPQSSNCLQ